MILLIESKIPTILIAEIYVWIWNPPNLYFITVRNMGLKYLKFTKLKVSKLVEHVLAQINQSKSF